MLSIIIRTSKTAQKVSEQVKFLKLTWAIGKFEEFWKTITKCFIEKVFLRRILYLSENGMQRKNDGKLDAKQERCKSLLHAEYFLGSKISFSGN